MGCHREFQLGRESDYQDIVEIIKQIYDQSSFLEIKQIKILFSLQKTEFTVENTGIIIVIIVIIIIAIIIIVIIIIIIIIIIIMAISQQIGLTLDIRLHPVA